MFGKTEEKLSILWCVLKLTPDLLLLVFMHRLPHAEAVFPKNGKMAISLNGSVPVR